MSGAAESGHHARSTYSPGSFIATSMPDDAPGSLTPAQSVDIVTYIMQMNDFETGPRELPADPTRLDAISLARIYQG